VAFEFGAGDLARTVALLEGYVAAGGPGRVDRPGRCSMVVAQLGHLGERACRLWLEETDPAERDRVAANAEEFLGPTRFTLARVEQLLAAARQAGCA
jgi:hypothetical protein